MPRDFFPPRDRRSTDRWHSKWPGQLSEAQVAAGRAIAQPHASSSAKNSSANTWATADAVAQSHANSFADDLSANKLYLTSSYPQTQPLSQNYERYARGYNPSYYGDVPFGASSAPESGDCGYTGEPPGYPPDTPMWRDYAEYKSYDERSGVAVNAYKIAANSVPQAPSRVYRTENYYGRPPMTSQSHRDLESRASEAKITAEM